VPSPESCASRGERCDPCCFQKKRVLMSVSAAPLAPHTQISREDVAAQSTMIELRIRKA
jgi:hypothetical protein